MSEFSGNPLPDPEDERNHLYDIEHLDFEPELGNPWPDPRIQHLDSQQDNTILQRATLSPLDFSPNFEDHTIYTDSLINEFIVSSIYTLHEARKTSPCKEDQTMSLLLTLPDDWKGYTVELHPLESTYVQNPSITLSAVDLRTHEYISGESKTAYLNPQVKHCGNEASYNTYANFLRKRNKKNAEPFVAFNRKELEIVARCLGRYLQSPGRDFEEQVLTYEDKELRFAHFLHVRDGINDQQNNRSDETDRTWDDSDNGSIRELITDNVLHLADKTVENSGTTEYDDDFTLKSVKIHYEIQGGAYEVTVDKDADRICAMSLNYIPESPGNDEDRHATLLEITLNEDGKIAVDEISPKIIDWKPEFLMDILNTGKVVNETTKERTPLQSTKRRRGIA